MFKKLAVGGIGIILLVSPLAASADQMSDLQAQLKALLAQIAAMQNNSMTPAAFCVDLPRTLTLGSTGQDVSNLQDFLANKDLLNANARGYYGFLTAQAVGQLQLSLGIVSSADDTAYGIMGPRTRAAISCKGTLPPRPNSSITVTAPNGGEQWEEGVTNTVTWAPYRYNPDINPSKDVTAYLDEYKGVKDDGTEVFISLGKVEENGKASIHWITGELDSATRSGDFVQPGSRYYIRVVNNKTGAWDRSDAPFTLLPKPIDLKINGSDGPVTIDASDTPVNLTWTSAASGVSDCHLSGLADIDYSKAQPSSGSLTAHVNVYDHRAEVGLYCQYNGAQVRDHVSVLLKGYNTQASLQVTSPNGGEQIDRDKQSEIRYSLKGLSSISTALYKSDQWKAWIVRDLSIGLNAESGIYMWTPSNILQGLGEGDNAGAIFKIYVTGQKADGTGYVDDKSDAPFGFTSGATNGAFIQTTQIYQRTVSFNYSYPVGSSMAYLVYAQTGTAVTNQALQKSTGSGAITLPDVSPAGTYYLKLMSDIPNSGSFEVARSSTFFIGGDTSTPTATLTANGQSDLTINPGDSVTYAWGSTNAVSSSASFTTDSPACGATTNGPFNWTLPQGLSGSTPFTPGSCSNGHTYTFTYTAVNESGQSASAKLIVHIASNVTAAPTATLTSNGQNIISVSDSDTVFFNWSSTNGANASLSYTVDDGPSYPVDYWYDFNVNPLSGATTAVFSGAAGQKRVYTYTVTGANGQTASSNLTAYINGGPAASAANPYANLANILSAIQAILEKMRGGQ